jgi:hypothetical protein
VVVHPSGAVEALAHIGQAEIQPGGVFEIHTPGGVEATDMVLVVRSNFYWLHASR